MTQWHADLNGTALGLGACVTVLSHHNVVRVLSADTLMIEGQDGQRLSALVLDRTGSRLNIVLPDGQHRTLSLQLDQALREPGEGTILSRQVWVSH